MSRGKGAETFLLSLAYVQRWFATTGKEANATSYFFF